MASPNRDWLPLSEAATLAGCTDGWLRLLLGKHKKEWTAGGLCWKAGERAWVVHRDLVAQIGSGLSTRSVGKRGPKPVKKGRNPRRKAS